VPAAVVDKVDVPSQLSTTVAVGVAGFVFGAAVPEPASLIQPLPLVLIMLALIQVTNYKLKLQQVVFYR
jgi:hypothetical protein